MAKSLDTSILDIIFSRRSVRAYAERALEPEILCKLLEAAMAAPTACNSQPWEFVVTTDAAIMDQLRQRLRFAGYNAPAAITVCGNVDIANNSAAKHFWVQDCSAAVENILIAAAGMKLGAVWIGVYPHPSVIRPVREVLNIPEQVIPLAVIYVGYPAEGAVPHPRTQFNDHRVYWQQYQPRKPKAKIKNAKFLD
jgi:nitroreductase